MLEGILRNRSSRNLPELQALKLGGMVTLEERIQPERDIFEVMEEVKAERRHALRNYALVEAPLLAGTVGSFWYSFTHNTNMAGFFGGAFGSLFSLRFAGHTVVSLSSYLHARSQINHAKHLSQEGYVFANELANTQLLPSQVAGMSWIVIKAAEPGGYLRPMNVYAVKEQPIATRRIKLDDLPRHIGEPVIVSANVSSAPRTEDMKMHGIADLKISGAVAGILPMYGTARGYVDGDVYVEGTPFRIMGNHGKSYDATMNYLPTLETEHALPVGLRRYSSEFDAQGQSHRNNLVHFLNEAKERGQELLFLGKVSKDGIFHIEAVARPENKEMYALAVYQPLSGLELK